MPTIQLGWPYTAIAPWTFEPHLCLEICFFSILAWILVAVWVMYNIVRISYQAVHFHVCFWWPTGFGSGGFPQQLWSFQGVIDAGGVAMPLCSGLDNSWPCAATNSQLWFRNWPSKVVGRPGKLTVCCQCCISMVRYCEAFLLRVAPDSDWHFLAKAAANNVTKNIKKKQHIFSVSAKDGGHIHKHL